MKAVILRLSRSVFGIRFSKFSIERGHPQKATSDPKPLCGLLHCGECGRMITAEVQKGHTYYRCTKKGTALFPTLCQRRSFSRRSFRTAFTNSPCLEAVRRDAELTKKNEEDEAYPRKKRRRSPKSCVQRFSDFSRNLDRLTDLYVAQDIDRENYLSRRRKLLSEKKSVEEQIARLERNACRVARTHARLDKRRVIACRNRQPMTT